MKYLNQLKIFCLSLISALVLSAEGRAEPILNLTDTDPVIEDTAREASQLLLRSVQNVYGSFVFLEEQEFAAANETLDTATRQAIAARDAYATLDGQTVAIRAFDEILQDFPRTAGRIRTLVEIYQFAPPDTFSQLVQVVVGELDQYQATLAEIDFDDAAPQMETVVTLQNAIYRIIYIGSFVPYYTRDLF